MRAVMAEMLGKVEGCSHGRGGSMHLFDAQRRLFGGNAIVAAASRWLLDSPLPTPCRVGIG